MNSYSIMRGHTAGGVQMAVRGAVASSCDAAVISLCTFENICQPGKVTTAMSPKVGTASRHTAVSRPLLR